MDPSRVTKLPWGTDSHRPGWEGCPRVATLHLTCSPLMRPDLVPFIKFWGPLSSASWGWGWWWRLRRVSGHGHRNLEDHVKSRQRSSLEARKRSNYIDSCQLARSFKKNNIRYLILASLLIDFEPLPPRWNCASWAICQVVSMSTLACSARKKRMP